MHPSADDLGPLGHDAYYHLGPAQLPQLHSRVGALLRIRMQEIEAPEHDAPDAELLTDADSPVAIGESAVVCDHGVRTGLRREDHRALELRREHADEVRVVPVGMDEGQRSPPAAFDLGFYGTVQVRDDDIGNDPCAQEPCDRGTRGDDGSFCALGCQLPLQRRRVSDDGGDGAEPVARLVLRHEVGIDGDGLQDPYSGFVGIPVVAHVQKDLLVQGLPFRKSHARPPHRCRAPGGGP